MKKQFDKRKKPSFGRADDDRGARGHGKTPGRFRAICGKCGDACEVPFKPAAGRAVLCKNCFKRDDHHEGGQRFESDRSGAGTANDPVLRQMAIINAKLDKILDILED